MMAQQLHWLRQLQAFFPTIPKILVVPRTAVLVGGALFLALWLGPRSTSFQAHGAPNQKRKAAALPSTHQCGQGVQLRLSSGEASQGSLLLAEVRSAQPVTGIKAEWNKQQVEFWQETEQPPPAEKGPAKGFAGARHEAWRGLLGVDLEQTAGRYELTLQAQVQGGSEAYCKASVMVEQGRFATEKLSVGKQFVEPNPEQVARANAEHKRLKAIFDQVTPERLWQGPFRLPLDGVAVGGNFGKRRVLNGQPGSPHGGVDFPAATGTLIHAAQRGRVVLAEPLYFSGNTVVVDHGLGIYTFYGHLVSIDAPAGTLVETGAVLGKVGATGRVTGPHLHWGLTVNRARVNPLQIVALFGRP